MRTGKSRSGWIKSSATSETLEEVNAGLDAHAVGHGHEDFGGRVAGTRAQAVSVRDLDQRHAGLVEAARDIAHLLHGDLMALGMHVIAE